MEFVQGEMEGEVEEREVIGEVGERLEVETEEGSIKKLVDPQVPSKEKVEMHVLNVAYPVSILVPDMR